MFASCTSAADSTGGNMCETTCCRNSFWHTCIVDVLKTNDSGGGVKF